MLREIKKRLMALERRILAKLPLWSDDEDGFISALSVDPGRYLAVNPDRSTGYDAIRALSDTAAVDWRAEK